MFLVALLGGAMGCSDTRPPAAPQIVSAIPPASSPLGAVESLAACWSRLDAERYPSLLTSDFVFSSADTDTTVVAHAVLDRARELEMASRMWKSGTSKLPPATTIEFRLQSHAVGPDTREGMGPGRQQVDADVDLTLRTPTVVHRVLSRCRFFVVRGDSAGGEGAPSPADSSAWFVEAWEERGPEAAFAIPGALRTLPSRTRSFWWLKQLYLAP